MTNQAASLRLAPPEKLVLHRQFVDYLEGKKVYPIGIEISPSGVCNATCPWCFYANTGELGAHRHVFLERKRLLRLLDECEYLGVKSISWTGGGEPTLHPNFGAAVEYAAGLGLEQGLFTNAIATPRYDPSLLQWIRITMTDRPYNIAAIKQLRDTPTLGFAFNYSGEQDYAYLCQTLTLAEQVKADYVQLRPALKFHGETVDITPPDISHPLLHVTDYKFTEARKKHGYEKCECWHLTGTFIWETGDVATCAYMRLHEGYTLGNLYSSSLQEILDGAPESVAVHEKCQICCKGHETNLLVHRSRELKDVNFP